MNLEKSNTPPPLPQDNPYAPPSEESMGYDEVGEYYDEHFGLLEEPRQCEAGRGISWLTEAFNIFKEYWVLWIGIGLVYFIIMIIVGQIPFVNFIWMLFAYHFTAGFILVCAEQEEGYQPNFATMFSAFQSHLGQLLILALWNLLFTCLIFVPIIIVGVLAGVGAIAMNNPDADSVLFIVLGLLVAMLFYIPLAMALYLAPALVVLHDIRPLDAMKMSFKGCLRNIIPFLLFGLIVPLVSIIGLVFTLGLGLFVLIPIMMISNYVIYRDIWSGQMAGE